MREDLSYRRDGERGFGCGWGVSVEIGMKKPSI
ncbi:MAG: hypothetical protein ACD_66C00016G0001, partial [uncultured bacterium]